VSVLTAPPVDNSPRVVSANVDDFAVPTGREEEWRFAPVADLVGFFQPDPSAGTVDADSTPGVEVVGRTAGDTGWWLPTDRAAAVAFSGADRSVVVRIPPEAVLEEPIVVTLSGTAAMSYGLVRIEAGRHSRATVVVLHDEGANTSGAVVSTVGDAADLTVLSVIDGPGAGTHLWHLPALVGRDARFTGGVLTTGGRVVRLVPSVRYAGAGGSAELIGAFLAREGQYLEHRTFVDHDHPHCASNVVYKGALTGHGARSVWVGDVLVRRAAVGTSTYEMNRNLILDEGPRADAVPNLELETGEVASAGHATATGKFDEEQLFYLMARGLPESIARQLVVRGFFADVVARIPSEQWRHELLQRIGRRLGMELDDAEGQE
jgi:Fe-S cluster assembly protein SufD